MRIRAALASTVAALVLAAPAGAVTITEFEIQPGAPASAHIPYRIHAWPDGNIYWSDQASLDIGRMSPTGERFAPIGINALAVDFLPSGNSLLYTGPGGFRSYDLRGGLTFPIGPSGESTAAAVDATGAVVADQMDAGGEGRICIRTNCAATVSGGGPTSDLQLGADGRLWGVMPQADTVFRVAPGSVRIDLLVPLPTGSGSEYLTAGSDGNIWATAGTADAVDRITPAGIRTRFPLPPGTEPLDIVTGPDGALWIAGSRSSAIVRMTTAGAVTNVFPTPTPNAGPLGVTAGTDGAIWFTELLTARIGRLVLDPVSAGSGGGGGSGGSVVRDTLAPRVTGTPRFSPARVRAGRSTDLRLVLSEPARLRITIAKRTSGRRVDGRCVRPTARNRRRARCFRYVTATTLNRNGIQGTNTIAVSARRLSPGTYRATIAATDPAGNAARAVRVTFTVTRR
jgi:streptogramin lyase